MNKTFTLKQLPEIVTDVIEKINKSSNKQHATIVTLQGDLGAGKTTFTQELARQLGVVEPVQSPTFVILKSYQINNTELVQNRFTNLIHIDAYRLTSGADLVKLDWDNYVNNIHNLILIEWPEMVADVVTEPTITINLEHTSIDTRTIATELS